MTFFWKTFYGKLSGLFMVLLLGMGIFLILQTLDASKSFHSRVEQQLNLNLARVMGTEIQSAIQDSLDLAETEHRIHYIMVLNPRIEIYLLDATGTILAFFAEPHKKIHSQSVALAPVKRFIDHHAVDQLPETLIVGDDPRHPGRQKPFSAARVNIGGAPGYLYVVTESEQYDSAAEMISGDFLTRTLIKGVLVSMAITALLGLVFFFLLTRRLGRVTAVVREFERGKMTARATVESDDEIGQLGESFNTMADTIEENLETLRRTDRQRRELVANISHDLRSPLASIRGYLETLQIKAGTLSSEEQATYLEVLLNITRSLNEQVEQLFELSKLDAMQIQPDLERFNLGDLIQDIVMKFNVAAEKKDIHLKAVMPPQMPQSLADIGLIERALSNLIDNALRYTPEKGTVTIAVLQNQDRLCVQVSDTGVGIEEEELPLIFDRFYRVEKSRARATGGTGLGLAIAQKIIELHNSAIRVTSQRNVGTTFSFDLAAT